MFLVKATRRLYLPCHLVEPLYCLNTYYCDTLKLHLGLSPQQKHLNRRRFHLSNVVQSEQNSTSRQPKLSPQEVTQILKQNEQSLKLREADEISWEDAMQSPSLHAILSADSNQLASNTPIEDKLATARLLLTTGFLFGVFDGHGGPECSQVVSKRLFDYIAASLLPRSELLRVISAFESNQRVPLTEVYNDTTEFIPELQEIYDASLLRWCKTVLSSIGSDFSMEEALIKSFIQLDQDIGNEVLENRNSAIIETLLQVALSGSVACIAHIDGPHLHIANAGDCGAVLGEVAENSHGGWVVTRLSKDHNWENTSEIKRILSEHPKSEENSVIHNQRLLGMLMPFRAFGDVRFKWKKDLQLQLIQSLNSEDDSYLRSCLTPPYLIAIPEVTYHRLRPHDKFLILASDGLWESMNALDIVTLVGEYMSGRQTLQPVHLPRRSVTLRELSHLLQRRQEGLRLTPTDTNACTHLIRHCLGSTEEGLDHLRLSHSLSLPIDVRRYFRDDISVHVIFFDSTFLRVCPIEL